MNEVDVVGDYSTRAGPRQLAADEAAHRSWRTLSQLRAAPA